MQILGQANTAIGAGTHRPLPTTTSYKPSTKRTGLNWAASTNPQIWAAARNETICAWPKCTRTTSDGQHCARHKISAQAQQRRHEAQAAHAPCTQCGATITQRPGDTLKAYENRQYCSTECRNQSRRKTKTPTTATGAGTRGGNTKTCKTCHQQFPSPPSSQVANCPTCRGTKTCTQCDQPRTAHGLCTRHYQQARKAN